MTAIPGDDDPPASVLRHAYAIGASAVRANCDFFFAPLDDAHWQWREVGRRYELPMPALAAPVQLRNAATAIAAGANKSKAASIGAAFATFRARAHPRLLSRYSAEGRASRAQRPPSSLLSKLNRPP